MQAEAQQSKDRTLTHQPSRYPSSSLGSHPGLLIAIDAKQQSRGASTMSMQCLCRYAPLKHGSWGLPTSARMYHFASLSPPVRPDRGGVVVYPIELSARVSSWSATGRQATRAQARHQGRSRSVSTATYLSSSVGTIVFQVFMETARELRLSKDFDLSRNSGQVCTR